MSGDKNPRIHANKTIKSINIQGFAYEPILTITHCIQLIAGLFTYPEEHGCDMDKDIKHVTKFGKILYGPYATYINKSIPERERSFILGINSNISKGLCSLHKAPCLAINKTCLDNDFDNNKDHDDCIENTDIVVKNIFVVFETGNLVLSFDDSVFPCKIDLNMTTTGTVDVNLIIDQLTAPAIACDGMGMVDYTYSINSFPEINSLMLKGFEIHEENSINNKKYKKEDFDKRKKNIYCIHCTDFAKYWDIAEFKTVPVCETHNSNHQTPVRPALFYNNSIN
jgi:hypothetical protein